MEASGDCLASRLVSSEVRSALRRRVDLNGREALRMLRGQMQGESRRSFRSPKSSLEASCFTDCGCERTLNEDRVETIRDGSAITWLLCDGMGGAAGGEFAAQLAVDAVSRSIQQSSESDPNIDVLGAAFREANRIILLRRKNPEFQGMGTTAVAMRFDGREAVISSIGDSRAYLVRDGAVQQLTVDDTFVQTLVDDGKLRAEEALSHPEAHVLTRCLGSEPSPNVHSQRLWLWPADADGEGDVVVLCSDGLYSLVPDIEIGSIASGLSPQDAGAKLIELARERGGFDNISVAVIRMPGVLRTSQPSEDSKVTVVSEQRAGAPTGTGVFKHFVFLAIMTALAAGATIAGALAFQFLR